MHNVKAGDKVVYRGTLIGEVVTVVSHAPNGIPAPWTLVVDFGGGVPHRTYPASEFRLATPEELAPN